MNSSLLGHLCSTFYRTRCLILTNDPPDSSESWEHLLQHATHSTVQYLYELEQELRPLEALVDRLREERDDATLLLCNRAILSPIRRLPLEVLIKVFLEEIFSRKRTECFREVANISRGFYDVADISEGPWLLASVCGRWRDIVLSNGSLWSHIFIDLHPDRMSMSPLSRLKTALSLSRNAELSVFLHHRPSIHTNIALQECLGLLSGSSQRWTDVTFDRMYWEAPDITIVNRVWSRVPNLKKLALWRPLNAGDAPKVSMPLYAFQQAPRLKDVSLKGYLPGFNIELSLPWQQLSHFNQTWATDISSSVDILFISPALTDLCLDHRKGEGAESPMQHLLPLPPANNVQRLLVSDPHLMDYLNVPLLDALEVISHFGTLSVLDESYGNLICHSALLERATHALIQRSRCTLKKLSIRCLKLSREYMDNLFFAVPGLLTLEIDVPIVLCVKDVLDRLLEPSILPSLTHLVITIDETLSWPQSFEVLDSILDIADKRQTLSSLHITLSRSKSHRSGGERLKNRVRLLRLGGKHIALNCLDRVYNYTQFY